MWHTRWYMPKGKIKKGKERLGVIMLDRTARESPTGWHFMSKPECQGTTLKISRGTEFQAKGRARTKQIRRGEHWMSKRGLWEGSD